MHNIEIYQLCENKAVYPYSPKRIDYLFNIELNISDELVEVDLRDRKGNRLHGAYPCMGRKSAQRTAERIINDIRFDKKSVVFGTNAYRYSQAFMLNPNDKYIYMRDYDLIRRPV